MIQSLKGETTVFHGLDKCDLNCAVQPSKTRKMCRKIRTNEHYGDEMGSFLYKQRYI